jgi:hypothetical protein
LLEIINKSVTLTGNEVATKRHMKQSWMNRTMPPVVVIAVVGCVWYALQNRPEPVVVLPSTNADSTSSRTAPTTVAQSQPTPTVSPTVTRLGTQLQFSVAAMSYAHVQKVEFYVENQFVGAAYSQPYSVAVSENDLVAGTHTVTAKIYTDDSTADSQPATFTAQPTAPPTDTNDTTDNTTSTPNPNTPSGSTDTSTPTSSSSTSSIAAPSDITANGSDDGTSATLNWTASDGAVHYQIWRDGAQVATTTGTGYTDTGLKPGQTYDYQIVVVDANDNASDPSKAVAVTMLTPQDTSPVNTLAPNTTMPPADDAGTTDTITN